jgi:hypothetical protein
MPEAVSPERPTEVAASPGHDRRLRRVFGAEDKRRILAEAGACTERWQLSGLLRRERLCSARSAATRAADEP